MQPITFAESNTVFAENQPEYIPLPAYSGEDGEVITCWRLSWSERLMLFVTGRVWLRMLTFNQSLQPVVLEVYNPFVGERRG